MKTNLTIDAAKDLEEVSQVFLALRHNCLHGSHCENGYDREPPRKRHPESCDLIVTFRMANLMERTEAETTCYWKREIDDTHVSDEVGNKESQIPFIGQDAEGLVGQGSSVSIAMSSTTENLQANERQSLHYDDNNGDLCDKVECIVMAFGKYFSVKAYDAELYEAICHDENGGKNIPI